MRPQLTMTWPMTHELVTCNFFFLFFCFGCPLCFWAILILISGQSFQSILRTMFLAQCLWAYNFNVNTMVAAYYFWAFNYICDCMLTCLYSCVCMMPHFFYYFFSISPLYLARFFIVTFIGLCHSLPLLVLYFRLGGFCHLANFLRLIPLRDFVVCEFRQ